MRKLGLTGGIASGKSSVAAMLREDESYLWPDAVDSASLHGAELVATYPRRTDVPRDLWTDLLRSAERDIDAYLVDS